MRLVPAARFGVLGLLPVIAAAAPGGHVGGAGERHWAYRTPVAGTPPVVRQPAWVRNPIDAYVLAKLEARRLAPSPEADRPTLLRRLTLDLIGLPPTPEEVAGFVADRRSDAWERQVDRLLASPHFGERWARHWMDLARYGDTDGFGPDRLRPYAWRWRDWVIRALNQDLPFDQFTVEQLAGDLLPNPTVEQQIATGFQRHTLTNREAGADPEESRTKAVVDRVNTMGAAWLGLTVGCAECHDHKYDPLRQKEFFQLYAFWNNADEADLPAPPTEQDRLVYEQSRKAYEAQLKDLEADLDAYRARLRQTLPEYERTLTGRLNTLPPAVRPAFQTPAAQRTAAQQAAVLAYYESADGGTGRRKATIGDHRMTEPKPNEARLMTLQERSRERRQSAIHLRGDFLQRGAVVEPATPAFLPPLRPRGARPDRLDLARWLVDPSHPLTGRVQANRVWSHLFGQGLAPTLEDFGLKGEPPSHPELLDWLAAGFAAPLPENRAAGDTENSRLALGWSVKRLIRLIVTSSTYRQVSRSRPELDRLDPRNRLLARQQRFRLDAESVRDAALAVGGLLRRDIGGPSFRPPLPKGAAEVAFRLDLSYTPDRGDVLFRRSLYQFTKRNLPNPLMTTFDAPDAAVTCTRRARTNTPLQALSLLNDPLFVEAARGMAVRVRAEAPAGDAAALEYAFQCCLARRPAPPERSALERMLADLRRIYAADPGAAATLAGPAARPDEACETAVWISIARALLNLDEMLTRE